ncbi:S1C family serine protease [bacterium]|nr:S1C family serine protease [bacterium]
MPKTSSEQEFSEGGLTQIRVYEEVNRSVANISTRSYTRDPFFMIAEPQEGAGSGSILDKEGHIFTNCHVIDGAKFINVTLFDGSPYVAEVVGADPENDTAVLRIDAPAEELFPVKFGESSGLRVGQKVMAIGNPFGLERTLSVGIVSALNRTLPGRVRGYIMKEIIQIDAALNKGNSGGPLLSSQGLLIGMNTAIANPSRSGENTGVGFAIPVNTLRSVVPQLIRFGRVIRPDLGIVHTTQQKNGLRINKLTPDGPAAKAGLRGIRLTRKQVRQGRYILEYQTPDYEHADEIVSIDGKKINSYSQLQSILENYQPGQSVEIEFIREGKLKKVTVTLGEQR